MKDFGYKGDLMAKKKLSKKNFKGVVGSLIVLLLLFLLKYYFIKKETELFNILFLDPLDTAIGFVFLGFFLFLLKEFFSVTLFNPRK